MVKHTVESMMAERDALQIQLDHAQKSAERWHKVAMDAGVIVFGDGHLEYPMRDQRDALQSLVYEACANFNPDDAPEPDGLIDAIRKLHARIAGLETTLALPDKARRQFHLSDLMASRGYFNRSDLEDLFGVSTPQASIDIQAWLGRNPGVARYDASAKRYVRVRDMGIEP